MTSRAAGPSLSGAWEENRAVPHQAGPGRSVGGRAYSLATWGVNRMYSVYVLGYLVWAREEDRTPPAAGRGLGSRPATSGWRSASLRRLGTNP